MTEALIALLTVFSLAAFVASTMITWITWGVPWWYPSTLLMRPVDKAAWDVLIADMKDNPQNWKRGTYRYENTRKGISIWTANGIESCKVEIGSREIKPPIGYRRKIMGIVRGQSSDAHIIVEKLR